MFKKKKITFNHGKIVNIFIVYKIEKSVNISSYPALENCLFGAVKLTKHVDVNLYKYSGYGIGFHRKGFFSHPCGGTGKNVVIFGVEWLQQQRLITEKKTFWFLVKELHDD